MGSRVKTKKMYKGRMLADVNYFWEAFREILPLQKSNDKSIKTNGKARRAYFFSFIFSFPLF